MILREVYSTSSLLRLMCLDGSHSPAFLRFYTFKKRIQTTSSEVGFTVTRSLIGLLGFIRAVNRSLHGLSRLGFPLNRTSKFISGRFRLETVLAFHDILTETSHTRSTVTVFRFHSSTIQLEKSINPFRPSCTKKEYPKTYGCSKLISLRLICSHISVIYIHTDT